MELRCRKVVANDSVVSAELDEESVLLDVQTGIYFGLDGVGTDIWRHVSRGATEDEIFDALFAEYEVDPAVLRADVSQFLSFLEEKGLARLVGE